MCSLYPTTALMRVGAALMARQYTTKVEAAEMTAARCCAIISCTMRAMSVLRIRRRARHVGARQLHMGGKEMVRRGGGGMQGGGHARGRARGTSEGGWGIIIFFNRKYAISSN